MRLILAALACAVMMSGCATVALHPTPEQVAAFPGSGKAIIGIGLNAKNVGCGYGDVNLRREGSNERVTIFTIPGVSNAAIVEPGRYTPTSAICRSSNMTLTLPNIDRWFLPVEVKADEVIHLGNLTVDVVSVETDKPDAQVLGDAVLTFGVSLLNGPNNTHEFPMYDVTAATVGDREAIRESIGDLADKMKSRKLFRVLSPTAVATAFRRAYAPHSDGTAPSQEEADAKFAVEMRNAISISIAELMKSQPPNSAQDSATPQPPTTAPAQN